MNLSGDQIKNSYGALLNIGASGATGTLQPVTDGFGNVLPFEVSTTTFNFTGNVTGGPIGPTGAAGSSGTSGTSGVSGTSGTSGVNGTSGTSGVNGSSGTSGTSGVSGSSGTSGADGSSGTSGTSGAAGSSGTSGTSGADGSSGTSGTSGANGSSGTSGTSGVNGSSGTSGTSGADGSSGTSGANGSSGTSGTSGADGSSGTSGTSGADGSSGTSGTSGADGSSGTSGVNGSSGTSGTSGADGSSGTSGTSGANGSSGTSGISGTSGTSGVNGATGAGASSPITLEQTNSLVSTGVGATAGENSNCAVVIGNNACTVANVGQSSVVIGNGARHYIYGGDAVVIGPGASVTNANIVSIGVNAIGESQGGVNIGSSSCTVCNNGQGNMAIGRLATAYGLFDPAICADPLADIAIGYGAVARFGNSLAIGRATFSCETNGISIGVLSKVFPGATGTIVLGNSSVGGTGACNSVVVGNSAEANVANSIFIGPGTINKSSGALNGAIVIGQNACIYGSAYNGHIVIGRCACAQEQNSTVVIGDAAYGENIGVAIGCAAQAGVGSVALGGQAVATGLFAFAGTRSSRATSQESIALGHNSCGNATCATALGANSCAAHTCSVALGAGITTERVNTTHVQSLVAYGQGASKLNSIASGATAATINWDDGNNQKIDLSSSITSLTLSNPIEGGNYMLEIVQGGVGSYTITWPASIKWQNATSPTLSTAVGKIDVVSFFYDGTNYLGTFALNFA